MRLKWVIVHCDVESNSLADPPEFAGEFLFKSNHVSTFLTRRARARCLETSNWSGVYVEAAITPGPPRTWENCLLCPVQLDRAKYESVSGTELSEFVVQLFEQGLRPAASLIGPAFADISEGIAAFRSLGYRNTWEAFSRYLVGRRLRASLQCASDPEKFTLHLQLERVTKGAAEVVLRSQLLRTLPDELCFWYKFKDFTFDGHAIHVRKRSGDVFASVDIEEYM